MSNIYRQNFVPASKGLIKSAPSSLIPDGAFQETMNVRFGDGYVEKVKAFTNLTTLPDRIRRIELYKKSNGKKYNMVHTSTGLYDINRIYYSWKKETEYIGETLSAEGDIVIPTDGEGEYCYKCIQGGTSGETEPTWTEDTVTQITDGTCIWVGVIKYPNLITDNGYEIPIYGHVSSSTAFDEYIFASLGTNIYYYKQGDDQAYVLEGTYKPSAWTASHAYTIGTIVRPTNQHYSGYIYKCTQAGTSGSTEPTWKKDLSTQITDGTTKWVGVGSLELEGTGAETLRAQCVEVYKGFLFVANTEEDGTLYPYRVRWSQWQNPRLWHNNDDGSGLSGYIDIDDTYGRILAIKKLGDVLYIYKERSIIALTYTGGEDTVFSKEVVTTVAGLIAPDAIVELPHLHIFVGQDNIYQFDGNTCTPIGDSVKQWVMQKIKPSSVDTIFGYYNEETGDITFSFQGTASTQDNCDMAVIYNPTQQTWSTREMFMTAVGQYCQPQDVIIDSVHIPMNDLSTTMIDSALYMKDKVITIIGDDTGKLYEFGGYNDSRHDYEGYVITKTHHMDAPDRIKRLMRIQFHIETTGDYNLYCQVGSGWNAETNQMSWTPKMYMNLQKPVPWYSHHVAPFIDIDLSARYFQIRFGTEHNGEPFKILGYTLFYQIRSDE